MSKETNPRFHILLEAFETRPSYGLLVNTLFNVRGEPIVCTSTDAHRCFMRIDMDALVLGNCLVRKTDQLPPASDTDWRSELQLD